MGDEIVEGIMPRGRWGEWDVDKELTEDGIEKGKVCSSNRTSLEIKRRPFLERHL